MSRGKKILIILLVIFAAIGGGGLWIYKSLSETQDELNAAVEPMIQEMSAAKWDKNVTDKYSSPQLKQWLIDHKMANNMSGLSILGNMKAYKGVKQFNASSNAAALVAEVEFDTGDAYIALQLEKQNGKWLMNSFNISSPALLPNAAGKQNAK